MTNRGRHNWKPVRRRFRFRVTPPPPFDIRQIARDLIESAERINKARDELRTAVAGLVGSDVDDWSIADCMRYAEGVLREYGAHEEAEAVEGG